MIKLISLLSFNKVSKFYNLIIKCCRFIIISLLINLTKKILVAFVKTLLI